MAERTDETRYLMDRAAIQDLLVRYFRGLDCCNPEQVRSCFTDDVQAHYDQRPPIKGIGELMNAFHNFTSLQQGKLKITTHFMGNLNFMSLAGDIAETETHAVAFLVSPGEGSGAVAMRSLRYLDKMRRQENGWRISDRIHTLDWSCTVPVDFAIALSQRISALPPRS